MPPRLTIEFATELVMISRRSGCAAISAAYLVRNGFGKYSASVAANHGSSGSDVVMSWFLR